MQRGEHTLNDLTEIAGVSARTVRYYIAEGLLPPPDSVGSRATYSQAQLDRLLLIGRLKEAYLPLKEIRRQLDSMTDEEVSASLSDLQSEDDQRGDASAPPAIHEARGEASDYIRRVLETTGADPVAFRRQRAAGGEERSAPRVHERRACSRIVEGGEPRRDIDTDTGSHWRRIELSPDAELLIREEAYRRNQSRIEWLINWAQRVFR